MIENLDEKNKHGGKSFEGNENDLLFDDEDIRSLLLAERVDGIFRGYFGITKKSAMIYRLQAKKKSTAHTRR